MSEDERRPDSQKTRQELLDEIYYLRDVAGEREASLAERERSIESLRTELDKILRSRSWRFTAPLRWMIRFGKRSLGGSSASVSVADAMFPHGGAAIAPAGVPRASASDARRSSSDRRDGTPRLFVDVTELALRGGKTGVQRVTREILRALLVSPPAGYVVEPVVAELGQPYRVVPASRSCGDSNSPPASDNELSNISAGRPMAPCPGDVFLGLDHAMQAVVEHADELAAMREQGVRIWFVCDDTLPLSRPDWFPPAVHYAFKAWFETIARTGDGIACISRSTEEEVQRWLDVLQLRREPPLMLRHFHLGADIDSCRSSAAIAPDEQAVIDRLQNMPSCLMVGTLEPRKGHAQALAAFNELWARGEYVALVIAGPRGWMTEVTQRRIRHHEEFGRRLFWFMHASDALLGKLYESCTVLLAPSEGEGFGLPLVEAARHGLPILCRDLPVFHEVAGEFATYFAGSEGASLAEAVERLLQEHRHGRTVSTARMPRLAWAESARKLTDVVLGDCRNVPAASSEQSSGPT